ncbi:MAG: septation protein IspZ, partial [Pseudomonadota bacterium]|nr:septation protein IspZ [Pseudomonadota bacterium]
MLKMLLGGQMNMAEEGWYRLGWLWSAMFVTSAIANEIAWRSLSTDGWVAFKAFGLTGISLLFAVASIPVFARYSEDLK